MKRLSPKAEAALIARLRYLLDIVENGAPVDHMERRIAETAALCLGADGRFLPQHVEDDGPKPPASLAPDLVDRVVMGKPQGDA